MDAHPLAPTTPSAGGCGMSEHVCPHCNNGQFDGTDVECVNGVLIDIDVAHDGWQRDGAYPAAPCCACEVCHGTGLSPVNIGGDTNDCAACSGTGWKDGKDNCQERLASWAAVEAAPPDSTTITRLEAVLAAKDAEIARLRTELKAMVGRAESELWHLDGSGPAQDVAAARRALEQTP